MTLFDVAQRMGTTEKVAKSFVVAAATVAIAALWLGFATVAQQREAAGNEGDADRDLAAAAEMSPEPKDLGGRASSETLGSPSEFQAFIEDQATRRNCSVSEFQVSPVPRPYVPPHAKDGGGQWQQLDVTFCVVGRLTDVYDAAAATSAQTIAFEPTSIEFDRQSVSDTGIATVVAHVQGRVIERGGNTR